MHLVNYMITKILSEDLMLELDVENKRHTTINR